MKANKIVLLLVFSVLLISFNTSKKKVLVIGDSISLGYLPHVKKIMAEKADIFHNPGNAQHTGTGLRMLDKWLGEEKYDVIFFNWGLWDLCYHHPDSKVQGQRDKLNGEITFTVDRYEANMEQLVQRLKKTGAKLVFVTSTVIPPGEAGRFEGDEITYNEAALAIMKKYKVDVCDLHKHSVNIHKQYKKADGDVHYTDEGYKKLGEHIAFCMMEKLK